ncbi:hypothetical protein PC114_g28177 [Phytophthora cactorum]|nr:hypothetical protein PC114_g28177 [Phytophthora cactorum]
MIIRKTTEGKAAVTEDKRFYATHADGDFIFEEPDKLAQEQDFTVEDNHDEPAPAADDNGKDDGPSLQELKEQAKAAGIKGFSTMNKPDLIDALAALPQKDDPYANAPTS